MKTHQIQKLYLTLRKTKKQNKRVDVSRYIDIKSQRTFK